ncbi:MAG: peptidoglycan-binding protein [Acidimicrobiaceae bacterium]|nr:peptidoglycan-binding protein [Acidimicrobiaceae bacterium]
MAVRRRKALGIVVALGLVAGAGAAALILLARDGDDGRQQPEGPDLITTAVAQRSLAEYLEVTGTLDYDHSVTLTAHTSGVLTRLEPEGTVVTRGESLYRIINDPTEADTADVLARRASARSSLVAAREDLSDALAGPSESDVAAARAALTDAREAQDSLVEPPTEAEIASAESVVATASEALEELLDPSPAVQSEARSRLSSARSDLSDLLAGASQAEVDSARAALAAAEADLADLREGASQAEVDSARAALAAAEADLADLREGASRGEIESAGARVLAAEEDYDLYRFYSTDHTERVAAAAELSLAREALADLLEGASESELDAAEAAVLSAEEALADLLGGASAAELDEAEAEVQAALEALDAIENPSEADRMAARAELANAKEALEDLLEGPTPAEIELAEAAVLAADDALADLMAGHSSEEIEALEASVASAEASVASAEADLAELGAGQNSLIVMYGSTPVYRTMKVGLSGEDVRQLEENLAEFGHGDEDGFTVDGVFDEATGEAVRGWQAAGGQDPDGMVGVADILFVAGPVRVGSWSQGIEVGQQLASGTALATLTVIQAPVDGQMSTTQRVIASVPLSDRDLVSEGTIVNVELPDDTDIAGTLTSINPSPVLDEQTGENAVEVTILLAEPASEVWIGATVDVEITETLIEDALVVPATALLALVEGGYALEVVAVDGSLRLIGVETGLFVDGDVEVRSPELSAGMSVVVPR